MKLKQYLSAALIVAIVGGLTPATTWADEAKDAAGARATDLRGSINRAVAQAKSDPSGQLVIQKPSRSAASATQMGSGGGGGGHVMMVVSILGTVAGVATSYFVIKQMQKTTDQIKTQ